MACSLYHQRLSLLGKGQQQKQQQQSTQKKRTTKVPIINKEILDKLRSDTLQCFSLGINRAKFCDFTVVVGATEFPCHRFVLNACSGFFEALLRSDMKERREMRATIHGISPEILNLILDVIYGNSENLVPDKMIDVWKAAHQLQIQILTTVCESYFMKNINADNCYLIYTHANLFQSPKVASSVLNYMIQNFYSLVQSDNFVKVDYEDFLQIMKKRNVQICADFKIEAILKWCEAENKTNKSTSLKSAVDHTRLPFLGNLIQAVDLANVTPKCLASLLTNPFIQEDKIANSAVNSQAANNLVNRRFHDDQRFNTAAHHWGNMGQKGEKNRCQHCNQSLNKLEHWSSDDSDVIDSDD